MRHSPLTILGAPSSIGIKPYEDGRQRRLDLAPDAFRRLGIVRRLGAQDAGDVVPPPYRNFVRVPGEIRNEAEMATYSRALADCVAAVVDRGRFPLVLGGDCGIVLGCLLGLRRARREAVGLAYVDGHADFASPAESMTGSVASMCLGLAVGRGGSPLAMLAADGPLVRAADVALVGRRDDHESYGHDALRASAVLDLPGPAILRDRLSTTAAAVLERVARGDLGGFWIHVDADVLDAAVMPAVDSPEPAGPGIEELAEFLRPLARHPRALGMELTIYDPNLDDQLVCAERLVSLLELVFA